MDVCWWPPEPAGAPTACQVFRPLAVGAWLSPKQDLEYRQAITTPIDSPLLRIESRIAFARGDRLRTSEEEKHLGRVGPCHDVTAVRLEEESRVKGLAQRDKHLLYADRRGDGRIDYYFDQGAVDCPEGDDAGLSEYFGTTETSGVFEEWLTPPPMNP
ncbi:MAG: hypothetical protein H0U89_01105 [Acidimicrobiia bacterium]|nr:hypothetical protein [Acidimicrobiia bacterium]